LFKIASHLQAGWHCARLTSAIHINIIENQAAALSDYFRTFLNLALFRLNFSEIKKLKVKNGRARNLFGQKVVCKLYSIAGYFS